METLSNAKLETILSLTGNNKCFECDSPDVDWVSFPSTVFLCFKSPISLFYHFIDYHSLPVEASLF
jgi:hypothetical protein